jgi:GH25 family lysozyme M1 (1,4-beta-N-acetylmuramidase)
MAKRHIGVDLARYQQKVDFPSLVVAGVEFAFIKCAGGATWVDPKFKENWQASKGILPRGAYLWFTDEDPFLQADHVISALDAAGDRGELTIAVDFEWTDTKFRGQALLDRLRSCLARIHAVTGKPPILYTGNYYWVSWASNLDAQDIVEMYPLWLAQYPRLHIDNVRECGTAPPVLPPPNCPKPWSSRNLKPLVWQFDGDHGCVLPNGIDADFNEYLGDDFDGFCGKTESMPETMPGADANPFPLNMSIQESNGTEKSS